MPSSDPAGHASYWRTPASTTWYQWKPQSSRSSARPGVAIERRRVAAILEVPVGDRAGLVDAALDVPARVEIVERVRTCGRAAAGPRGR